MDQGAERGSLPSLWRGVAREGIVPVSPTDWVFFWGWMLIALGIGGIVAAFAWASGLANPPPIGFYPLPLPDQFDGFFGVTTTEGDHLVLRKPDQWTPLWPRES